MTRSFEKFSKRLEAVGLFDEVLDRALQEHVTLRDLYEGPVRAPSVANARRKIYKWLLKEGKGLNEIARLFDRAPNGVWKLTQQRRKRKV